MLLENVCDDGDYNNGRKLQEVCVYYASAFETNIRSFAMRRMAMHKIAFKQKITC